MLLLWLKLFYSPIIPTHKKDLNNKHNFNPEKIDELFDIEEEEKIEAELRRLGYI